MTVCPLALHKIVALCCLREPAGIAGGVVTQATFQKAFGVSASQVNTVSANVVSVLQAGAFFGALGSAPISCMFLSSTRGRDFDCGPQPGSDGDTATFSSH
jgi:hypothetical protein